MSADLQNDLEKLRGGKTNLTNFAQGMSDNAKDNYASTSWNVILCAILFGCFCRKLWYSRNDNSSGKSELNLTLILIGPVGGYGWAYEGHMGALQNGRHYVKLSEIAIC